MAVDQPTTPDDASAVNATTHPDAYLLRLGAELEENRRLSDAAIEDVDDLSPDERAAAWDLARSYGPRFHEIQRELMCTPSLTRAGERVKARAIMSWMAPGGDEPAAHEDGIVAWSLARDVLREPDVDLDASTHPDAELVALALDFAAREGEQDAFEAVRPATGASCEGSDRINEELPGFIERGLAFTACTPDGIGAKLVLLRTAVPYALRDLDKVTVEQTRLAWTVVRDLIAMGTGS